jgi:hypothetical protein
MGDATGTQNTLSEVDQYTLAIAMQQRPIYAEALGLAKSLSRRPYATRIVAACIIAGKDGTKAQTSIIWTIEDPGRSSMHVVILRLVMEDVAALGKKPRTCKGSMRNASLSIGGRMAATATCHSTSPRFGTDF